MPLFQLTDELQFPHPSQSEPEGLLAVGGDLSIPRLLLAYSRGIFPWYSRGEPILWWSPVERAVVAPPGAAHFSKSLRKLLKKGLYEVRTDTAFAEVIEACAHASRPGQRGTWIVPDMQRAYVALHEAGFAHSFETYRDGELIGGLYGISLGGAFFGESMFSRQDNGSKIAFAKLVETLATWSFDLIDCQLQNENVARYGAALWSRRRFLEALEQTLKRPTRVGKWTIHCHG